MGAVEAFGRKTGAPNILQISHEERPEQYRGVPILAPAIEELKQMHRYSTGSLLLQSSKAILRCLQNEGRR